MWVCVCVCVWCRHQRRDPVDAWRRPLDRGSAGVDVDNLTLKFTSDHSVCAPGVGAEDFGQTERRRSGIVGTWEAFRMQVRRPSF